MKKNEIKERIQQQVEAVEKSIKDFSNEMKPEGEREICAAFLRCLTIHFKDEEIIPVPKRERCPDVRFRSAAFEVKEILTKGRKRDLEYKQALAEYKNAKTIGDLWENVTIRPKVIPLSDVYSIICAFVGKYTNHYAPTVRASLDLLVYVNISGLSLQSESGFSPEYESRFSNLGWRSISMLMDCCGPVSYSVGSVLYLSESGPDFLGKFLGQLRYRENKCDLYKISRWKHPL